MGWLLGGFLKAGLSVVGAGLEFYKSKNERETESIKAQYRTAIERIDLQRSLVNANKELFLMEAQGTRLQRLPRPLMLLEVAVAIGLFMILIPFVEWMYYAIPAMRNGEDLPDYDYDINQIYVLLSTLLGLGSARTIEKFQNPIMRMARKVGHRLKVNDDPKTIEDDEKAGLEMAKARLKPTRDVYDLRAMGANAR